MTSKIRTFLAFILCMTSFCLFSHTHANDVQIKQLFSKAENTLAKENISHTEFADITQKLRDVKSEENNLIRQKTIAFDEKTELLKALGDPENKGDIEESREIKSKRKNIQDDIQKIDTEIKSSQLNVAASMIF